MGERKPAEVFSLASYLAEEMEARGWTSMHVGIRMSADDSGRDEISRNILVVELLLACQDDGLVITPQLYRQLERAFGVSEGFFEQLNQLWLEYPDRRVKFEAPEYLFSQ